MKTVYAKINKITEMIGVTKADGYNTNSKYNYISYEQMEAKLRHLLPAIGLTITPEVIEMTERSTEFIKKDKWGEKTQQVIRSIVKMKFYITDTETGDTIERLWFGADQDYGGKSCGQAITEGVKRFQFKLFHVSTKTDKDPDSKTTIVEDDGIDKDLKPIKIDPEQVKKTALRKTITDSYKLLSKNGQAKINKAQPKDLLTLTLEELQGSEVAIAELLDAENEAKSKTAEKKLFNDDK